MGKRGPKPLSAEQLERQGSWRAEPRLNQEREQEREKRLFVEGVLNQTFLETYLGKELPFSQGDIDDACDYLLKLGPAEFIRVFAEILRSELEGFLGVKIKSKYDCNHNH